MTALRHMATRRLRDFAGDRRAIAATEFALILPVLIILYLGSVDATQTISVDRKVTAAINAVGDLVAQAGMIENAEMDDIFHAATEVLIPYDASPMSMVVSSVLITDSGAEVLCSKGYEMAPRPVGASIAMPDDIAAEGATFIVAEGHYDFTPIFGAVFTKSISLSDTFYLRPRATNRVAFEGC